MNAVKTVDTLSLDGLNFPESADLRNAPAPVKEPKREVRPDRKEPPAPQRAPIQPIPREDPGTKPAPCRNPSTCPMP